MDVKKTDSKNDQPKKLGLVNDDAASSQFTFAGGSNGGVPPFQSDPTIFCQRERQR